MKEEVKELVIARLDQLPSNVKISIGGVGSFTKDELINHVKEGDSVGERVAEVQLAYIRSFIKN